MFIQLNLETYYLQYFVAPGRPNKAPKIVPTSVENGSQEPSMLRPVFSTCLNRLRSPSGAISRRFFNIKSEIIGLNLGPNMESGSGQQSIVNIGSESTLC